MWKPTTHLITYAVITRKNEDIFHFQEQKIRTLLSLKIENYLELRRLQVKEGTVCGDKVATKLIRANDADRTTLSQVLQSESWVTKRLG